MSLDQVSESSGVSGTLETGDALLEASESSVGAVFTADFGNCHPNLLLFLDSCKRSNLVSIHTSLFLRW